MDQYKPWGSLRGEEVRAFTLSEINSQSIAGWGASTFIISFLPEISNKTGFLGAYDHETNSGKI